MFEKNVGGADRFARILIGSIMLLSFLILPLGYGKLWMLLGVIPLATGIMGTCGLYRFLGMNTCPMPKG
ncbi:MAG: DUF2892 domain-containing protein [Rhodobacteraceae bacterium]|jgi:uncharacterized membrane protein YccC|nr:DUF2892 domain-containing protein [Paracoccaceae bacterium]MBL4558679.1 DUF2892 domain-containing protein [Paracoccaceae bacterium]